MDEWDTLERSEKSGPPAFTQYFHTHKLDDMRTKIAAFVIKGIVLGNKMYEQNFPGSVHNMRKAWLKFIPQEMDRFINLYDCSIIRPGRRNGVVSHVRQVGSLPPVSTILTNQESCRDDPKRAQGFPYKCQQNLPR